MKVKILFALLIPVLLIVLPFLMMPEDRPAKVSSAERLVLISAHPEPIRYEMEHAFRKLYRKRHGKDIVFDWRNVGGTSEIVRYINDRYEAEFRLYAKDRRIVWTKQTSRDFRDPRLSPENNKVRKLFLESNVGIGIDLFFGGGTYDQSKFANIGYGVDAGVGKRHPEYFDPAIIPCKYAGDEIYDPKGRFYGVCLATFGIACNLDTYRDHKMPLPKRWQDLGSPELAKATVIADPTKSGSIAKCYEMIVQQAMAELGPEKGWIEGFARIRRIVGNARYVTDSAGKLVRDVSSGTAFAGMCIDFYGLSEADYTKKVSGKNRVRYIMPENGSCVSADPIQLLRGAPNRKAAEEFIDFLLSKEGQKIWIQKAGTPGGPEKFEILRPCVRRDLLTDPALKKYMSYPDYDPYTGSGTFVYHPEWTGRAFNLIRIIIKCNMLDPKDDLQKAYFSILNCKDQSSRENAIREFNFMPVQFKDIPNALKLLSGTPGEVAAVRRQWTESSIRHYRNAAELIDATAKSNGIGFRMNPEKSEVRKFESTALCGNCRKVSDFGLSRAAERQAGTFGSCVLIRGESK